MPKQQRLVDYLIMVAKLWGKHISGPILALVAIVAVFVNARYADDATATATVAKYIAWITGGVSAFLVLVAQYGVWSGERDKYEAEVAKNEAAPKIDMRLRTVVPHGSLHAGMTDLFVNLELVLGEPSRVSIRDFSLAIFDDNQSSTVIAIDDVEEWELVKRNHTDGTLSHVRCIPLVKELTRRGDPVQGWIHFPIPNLLDSLVQRSGLTIKVNGIYGTCYFQLNGAYARPDPDVKGVMRKVVHGAA